MATIDSTQASETVPTSPTRPWQFPLRSLFWLTTACGAYFGLETIFRGTLTHFLATCVLVMVTACLPGVAAVVITVAVIDGLKQAARPLAVLLVAAGLVTMLFVLIGRPSF